MDERVLIVTHAADVHADIVEAKLWDRGSKPFRINLDQFPRDFLIDLGYGPAGCAAALRHMPSGDELSLTDVAAIWARKPAKFAFGGGGMLAQEQAFAQSETEHLFFGLLYSLDCFWVSHPRAVRGALWKGEQLQRAARQGFRVPRSVITNSPEAVDRFRREVRGDIIFKAMSSPSLCAEDVEADDRRFPGLPTTRLTDEHLEAIDSVRLLPCLFQEYVPKRFELRVTVIGDRAFAAKIHSQQDSRTATDYRNFAVEIPYEPATLPADLESRCIGFVRSYGLEFGALDLIVTPQDEVVFLENNPGGQFLFVEQLVPELRMTDAVADLLFARTGAGGHGRAVPGPA